jgi:hypothetical protein
VLGAFIPCAPTSERVWPGVGSEREAGQLDFLLEKFVENTNPGNRMFLAIIEDLLSDFDPCVNIFNLCEFLNTECAVCSPRVRLPRNAFDGGWPLGARRDNWTL